MTCVLQCQSNIFHRLKWYELLVTPLVFSTNNKIDPWTFGYLLLPLFPQIFSIYFRLIYIFFFSAVQSKHSSTKRAAIHPFHVLHNQDPDVTAYRMYPWHVCHIQCTWSVAPILSTAVTALISNLEGVGWCRIQPFISPMSSDISLSWTQTGGFYLKYSQQDWYSRTFFIYILSHLRQYHALRVSRVLGPFLYFFLPYLS